MCDNCKPGMAGNRIPEEFWEGLAPHLRGHVSIQSTKQWAFEAAAQHEENGCAESPAGQVCWTNRLNILAYIAHALGFTPQMLISKGGHLVDILKDYERAHVQRNGAEG